MKSTTFFPSKSIVQLKTALLLAVLLLSCGHSAKPEPAAIQAAAPDPAPFPRPAPKSREADDAARFLAGLPSKEGSSFAELEKEDAWKVHRAELDRMWGKTETQALSAMRQFQIKELNTDAIRKSTLFYPFSGPDALMMNVFFPGNSTYVMVGLEPPGTLPTPAQFRKKKDLATHLAQERNTVNDVLGRSFFITQYMDRQFRGQVTDGLFQPIIHLLVRTNHSILGYQYVKLDASGKIVPRELSEGYKVPNSGIEVDFVDDSTKAVHRLTYFSINIDDKHLTENTSFSAFVSQLKGMTTYFKATSYMTHRPEFSIVRNLVLDGSATILQDDSGLPYKVYTDPRWHVQLYGNYETPIRPFKWLEQKDLRQAYQTGGAKPLNFHIGYGLARLPSNLLLATRVNETTRASARN